jgi:anaerobic ribonucleoside-triphosphate reductase
MPGWRVFRENILCARELFFCPECGSHDIYKRTRKGGYYCNLHKGIFEKPLIFRRVENSG